MTLDPLNNVSAIAMQMSAAGKNAREITKVLAGRGYNPNDVLGAIEALGLDQASISDALLAAIPRTPARASSNMSTSVRCPFSCI